MSSKHIQHDLVKFFKSSSSLWKYVAIASVLLLLMFVFKQVVILALLFIVTVLVSILVRIYGLRGYGIEFATLLTVLTGYTLGASWGAAIGAISIFIHMLISGNIGIYMLWVMPSYIIGGIAAAAFSGSAIAPLGIGITIFLLAVFLLFTVFLNVSNLGRFFIYVIGNVILNVLLFTNVAPFILRAIG